MDEIWTFVEEKLKASAPTYCKYVLDACGYSNGISISLIDDDDLKYVENEVKNGNVGKALADAGRDGFLKDCPRKAENFEFLLGHKKFLLAVANFLKNYIAENGVDSLISDEDFSKNRKIQRDSELPSQIPPRIVDMLVPLVKNTLTLDQALDPIASSLSKLDLDFENHSTKANLSIVDHQVLNSKSHDKDEFDENQNNYLRGTSGNITIDDNSLEIGKYVIYCLSLKSWICWPDVKPPVKHFIGQVCFLGGPNEIKHNSEVELLNLRKSPYKRHNFSRPEICETVKVQKRNILKVLQEPIKNRRDEFVFEDKSLLDYAFD